MLLAEWCCAAQADQNTRRVSHLHANYRSSRNRSLLIGHGLTAFERALALTHSATLTTIPTSGGIAAAVVDEVHHHYYRPGVAAAAGITGDFRMAGLPINGHDTELFVSLYAYPTRSTLSATGSTASRITAPPAPDRLKWLSRKDRVIEKLGQKAASSGAKLTILELFQELVSLLGLKSWYSPITYGVNLYRVNGGSLRRPHALSGGYEDRFCGTSPFRPFGSTADNRSGLSGLPEAIAFEVDLHKLGVTDREWIEFRNEVTNFAPDLGSTPPNSPLEFSLDTAALHQLDLPYTALQPIIIRRLKGNKKMCARNGGKATCCCDPTAPLPGSTP